MKVCQKEGFTLIELLVVIAIIGFLASIMSLLLNQARVEARNARRVSDVLQVVKALELYEGDNAEYPNQGAVGNPNNETDLSNLADFLAPKYILSIPEDPKPSPNNYMYVWKQPGKEYGIFVPFGNDGGVDCQIRTSGGSKNWFNKAPDCEF